MFGEVWGRCWTNHSNYWQQRRGYLNGPQRLLLTKKAEMRGNQGYGRMREWGGGVANYPLYSKLWNLITDKKGADFLCT